MADDKISRRLDALEVDDPEGRDITIDVQYDDCTILNDGQRMRTPIPAEYDDAVEFREIGNGDRMRVRYPKEPSN